MGEWINADDKLPEWPENESDRVLVYSETHDWNGSQYEIMEILELLYRGDAEYDGDADNVTHWMPLPDRPKQ